jgi:pyruvate-formate lyase-activating enzyme
MLKLRILLLSTTLVLGLSGCGYDGHYRYPCQNPENWESAECKPPICTANGACPEDLAEQPKVEGTQNG